MKFTDVERAEIVREFRMAKDPLKQIRILADTRDCKTSDIQRELIASGVSAEAVDLRRKPQKKQPPRGNKIRSAVSCLKDELANMEERRKQIPDLIAALEQELEGIESKKAAICAAIKVLEGMT